MEILLMEMVPLTTKVVPLLYCCLFFHKEYEVMCLNNGVSLN